jgi:hypothetical protein
MRSAPSPPSRLWLIPIFLILIPREDRMDEMMVIGSPAKAVRALTPEEVASLAENAREYVQIGRDLAAQGLIDEGFAANLGVQPAPPAAAAAQNAGQE